MRASTHLVSLVTIASLGVAIGPMVAHAQDEPAAEPGAQGQYRFELGLFGGLHVFDSESTLGRFTDSPPELSPKDNVAFGLRLGFNFNRWLAFEGEVAGTPTQTVDEQVKMWVFGYRAHLLLHLMPPGVIRPFILAGFGALSSVSDDESVIASDVDGFFHGGVGLKIAFSDRVGVRLEGRILIPPAAGAKVVSVGDETGYHGPDFEALGGLYVAFGPPIKQTVVKVEKEIVKLPPPPNPDPDGDGIANEADKCPNVAEDKDGFEDDDGCPDPDNDKDGIPDLQDKCPNEPEDKDGFEDDDGCPDLDNDKDGIPDTADKCPNEPETKNNFKDDDGCPDEIPQDLKRFTGVIQGINFKTGSDKLLKNSFPLLDRAVKVLQDYPDTRLEISGHTDSKGKADKNRDLSQRRAESVKKYFVSKGISADRLEAVGYGQDQPIASNKSSTGRSKNRRTEFKLLGQAEKKP